MTEKKVMDVLPWPHGQGFSGGGAWWEYVLGKDERSRLDTLLGLALLDDMIREKLLVERDKTLFDAFGISENSQQWLRAIHAATLDEFAQAIVSGQSETEPVIEAA